MDSHPYGYQTFLFTFGAPHEEVQGRPTKLQPGFTLGKLVQPSPGISILRDSHIVLSNGLDDVLQNSELPHLAVDIVYLYFFAYFYKNLKMAPA